MFKNATLKKEALAEVAQNLKDDLENLAVFTDGEVPLLVRQKALELPSATRMWSNQSLCQSTFEQKRYTEEYFDRVDPGNPRRLTAGEQNEVKHLSSHLDKVRQVQVWAQGAYVTSTGAFVVVEDLKALFEWDSIPIRLAPEDPEEVLVPVARMPPLAQALVANITKEFLCTTRAP